MTARIQIKGLDKLVKKIDSLEKMTAVKAALKGSALYLARQMREYPAKPHFQHRWPFKSDKQRRYFFWALRQGKIEVPYRRGQSPGTEDLMQRWTRAKPRTSNKGLTVAIGINSSYAQYVQSDENQSRMHKLIGWKTDKQVLEANEKEVTEYLEDAIQKIINS